jgi:hypothetical protein
VLVGDDSKLSEKLHHTRLQRGLPARLIEVTFIAPEMEDKSEKNPLPKKQMYVCSAILSLL